MSPQPPLNSGTSGSPIWNGLLALLLVSGILSAYVSGLRAKSLAEVHRLETEHEILQESLPEIQSAEENLPALLEDIEKLKQELADLDEILPPELDWDAFVDGVEEDAQALGLDLAVVSVGIPGVHGSHRFQETEFSVRGSLAQIAKLPEEIEARTALREVTGFSLPATVGNEVEVKLWVRAYAAADPLKGKR